MWYWLRHRVLDLCDRAVIAYLSRCFLGETGAPYPKAKLISGPIKGIIMATPGQNRKNGQDDFNNPSPKGGGTKRINPISGRVTRSKSGTGAERTLFGNGAGLSPEFGNGIPIESGRGSSK